MTRHEIGTESGKMGAMRAQRKSVRLTIEGSDMMVSIFPEDGEVRVTSTQFVLESHPDGVARESGYTLVITRGDDNPFGRNDIKRRPTHHVTLDNRITEA